MEFIAIRENQKMDEMRELWKDQHPVILSVPQYRMSLPLNLFVTKWQRSGYYSRQHQSSGIGAHDYRS